MTQTENIRINQMELSKFSKQYPKLFRKARLSKKLSQAAISKKLGITAGNVCHYEKQIREPNLSMLDLWAKTLGLQIDISIH